MKERKNLPLSDCSELEIIREQENEMKRGSFSFEKIRHLRMSHDWVDEGMCIILSMLSLLTSCLSLVIVTR